MTNQLSSPEPWPEAPQLPGPIIMDQRWTDTLFLHWRLPESAAAAFMPPGVVPDVYDGSSWVGLIGFRMRKAALGRGPAIPFFGDFNEVNVRLYSRGPDGTRGVVFLSLDADRLAVVLAARAAGIPYVWSRTDFHSAQSDGSTGYSVRRFRGGARSEFAAIPELEGVATDPLSVHLTARFGLHTTFRGRTLYIPNTHSAWPLHQAEVTQLDDGIVNAAGIGVAGPPESVLFSPGVRTQFGRPRVLST
ncbi:YqjF family protein [Pseudarthrobacter sp. DSP2-3-2b1]|uniref:YqjF family protein n=1 Tax=Pseudarthrobacter sp. DSP2-3-2b1 TaxID=2804661 RepID=UPI003CF19A67